MKFAKKAPLGVRFECPDCGEDHVGFHVVRPIVQVMRIPDGPPRPDEDGVTVQCVRCLQFFHVTEAGVERRRPARVAEPPAATNRAPTPDDERRHHPGMLNDLLFSRDRQRDADR